MRMYEPKCHDDMLAVAKTMKNLGFASVWLGMKRVNYKLRADDVGHGNIWERRYCNNSSVWLLPWLMLNMNDSDCNMIPTKLKSLFKEWRASRTTLHMMKFPGTSACH